MDKKPPYLTATKLDDGKIQIQLENITLLDIMATSMILMDKVYDKLKQQNSYEMAELVGSVLETISSLVLLASDNSKGN